MTPLPRPLKVEKTENGLPIIKFRDLYGEDSSLQMSSAIGGGDPYQFHKCIWLGRDGRTTPSRMHLTQAMVTDLLPYLIKFAETGSLE